MVFRVVTATIAASVAGGCRSASEAGDSHISIVAERGVFHSIGDSTRLRVQDGSGHLLDPRNVEWSSSAPGVVSVAPDGEIHAVSGGSAVIIAQRGPAIAQTTVSVEQVVATISIQPSDFGMVPGANLRLSAAAHDSLGVLVPNVPFTWRTSNPAVVSVTADGVASAHSAGAATIEAAGGGTAGNTTVLVTTIP